VATITDGKWQGTIWPVKQKPATSGEAIDYAVDGLPKRADPNYKPRKPLLYDLQADPAQTTNLAADNPEILGRMRRHFVEFLAQCRTDPEIVSRWSEE